MSNVLCTAGTQRNRWAVSLCFSSATLLGIEAVHGNACAWMGFTPEQSFALSALLATVSIFLATFLMTKGPSHSDQG